MKRKDCFRFFTLILVLTFVIPAYSQAPASRLVIGPIDETNLVSLHGNVSPLAQACYDRGVVSDALPAGRILLLLNRPPEREVALMQFLRDVHNKTSASYHQWTTPEQFGVRFGAADADIQTAAAWLQSHGFTVASVGKSKQFIEFSGNAGQLRDAFHTAIRQYSVHGEMHYANATEISVPAALAPLVRGVSPLNDFRAKPYVKVAGRGLYSRATKRATPLWTIPNPFGTSNPNAFLLAPEDFATQYDLTPLYEAGVNGTGQTIGIINESNIDVSLVNDYRQLFGLPSNPTQVVIDGTDPGTLNGVDVEAYLDVELAGALAPNATVNLYISDGGDLQDPLALAAIRAVEDNQASVLSVSFGQCESILGNAGNQFWSSLWEQAAAQGQTVFVASGDTGPYCNGELFMAVSGFASTPWNVAVGGTDFFYSDYATGGASATTLWNQSNDSNLGSLKAPLPEQVWNDPFGLDIISNGLQRNEIFAGGSGASSCSFISASNVCSGYAKPNWQAGPGVPADGVRDIPDVSLFASNGANLSAYPICAFEGECIAGANGQTEVLFTGGTSASSPAMAAIMALVDQKYGRQGLANFTLYPLAQQHAAAFHDITLGSNDSPCQSGSTDCAQNANGFFATTIYSAGPGYDLASGLGSIDANELVNNWKSVTSSPTTTALTLSATKVKHGTPVTVATSVSPGSGSGTPSGGVTILTTSPSPASQSQTVLTLNGGKASSSVDFFPGGNYNVTASYSGDGVFGSSVSAPVALDVTPENSNINFSALNGNTSVTSGGSVQYNTPLTFNIQPTGLNASTAQPDGNATGAATFTVDSTTATVALEGSGIASWAAPALAPGSHTANAAYSGDASFNASSAKPVTFTVTKGVPLVNDFVDAPIPITSGARVINVPAGGSLTITVVVGPIDGIADGLQAPLNTATPTGTVTVCLGPSFSCNNATYSQTATLNPSQGIRAQYSSASATLANLAAGDYVGFIAYSGDTVWQSQQVLDAGLEDIQVGSASALPTTTTTLTINPASISSTQPATITTTVTGTGSSGFAPGGEVDFFDNGIFLTFILLPPSVPGTTNQATFLLDSSVFQNSGANQLEAIFDGDTQSFQGSISNIVDINVQQGGDFILAPQIPQITVKSGGSGAVPLNLSSLSNFNGSVTLTCTPSASQITCGVNPSTVALNGIATATLTINAPGQNAGLPSRYRRGPVRWLGAEGSIMIGAFALIGFAERKRRLAVLLGLLLLGALLVSTACGSGPGNGGQLPPPPPPPNTTIYSVLVSATANGITHTSEVLVAVTVSAGSQQ
jgi:pro-kumamolisin-like protein/Big-like domain-containing protein